MTKRGPDVPPAATTTAVVADGAFTEPAAFDAVTSTRSVEPASASTATYVVPAAPLIVAHAAPELLQRCQTIDVVIGALPVHVPLVAVSVIPTRGVPLTVGATVLVGGAAVTATWVEPALAEPTLFAAVTVTRTLALTSAATSVYVVAVAPEIGEQPGLQRSHCWV